MERERADLHEVPGMQPGPVTVLEKGDYAGEAVLPFTRVGGELIVPYAVELGIGVHEEHHPERVTSGISVRDEYLLIQEWDVQRARYRIHSWPQVLRSVAENQQLRDNEFRRAFVLMQYYGYLRRNPDDAPNTDFTGWAFWLGKLNEFNGNFVQAEMVKAFLESTEYIDRFGTRP